MQHECIAQSCLPAIKRLSTATELTGANYKDWCRTNIGKNNLVVYLWFREEQCLYIGRSRKAWQRLLGNQKIQGVKETDVFYLVLCSDKTDWAVVENQLILFLQPTFNVLTRGTKVHN